LGPPRGQRRHRFGGAAPESAANGRPCIQ
jgi:hypothetical protein